MGASKERLLFLKWRKDNYPLLKSEHSDSNFIWQAWQGRAAINAEVQKPTHNSVSREMPGFAEINNERLSSKDSILETVTKKQLRAVYNLIARHFGQ